MTTLSLLDRGLLPDWVLRRGIRHLLRKRLRDEDGGSPEANERRLQAHVAALSASPIALSTASANEQHYEVPAAFFGDVLGRHRKYSCGLWTEGVTTLDEAEEAMLRLTVERAGIEDGMEILELGCGWGSLALYVASRFPACRILAISNSTSQREYIEAQCAERGLENVEVVTRDINDFETTRRFDRVVSVEMFEHVRNYAMLMEQISTWLRPGGLLFVHVFVHHSFAYPFETEGASNWLGRHFFTGGQMPSADLLPQFREHLQLVDTWPVNGMHYAKTARAWLANLDHRRASLQALLSASQPAEPAAALLRRWRVFFMACEELWGFGDGDEWYVQHYLFRPHQSALGDAQ